MPVNVPSLKIEFFGATTMGDGDGTEGGVGFCEAIGVVFVSVPGELLVEVVSFWATAGLVSFVSAEAIDVAGADSALVAVNEEFCERCNKA